MNFRHFFEQQEYDDFVNWLQSQGSDVYDLVKQLSQKPPDHHGGNADFWYIPQSKEFGLKIIRGSNISSTLTQQHNPFGDMNVGQPVASLGNGVQIVKLQQGHPAGPKTSHRKLSDDEKSQDLKAYRDKLFQTAEMPSKAYDNLLQQMIKINQLNHSIDPSKSGNLLIEPGKGFNLVDIGKTERQGYKNNPGEIIVMLMGGNHTFPAIKNPETEKAAQTMIKKVEAAAKKVGIDIVRTSSVDYSYKLAFEPSEPANSMPQSKVSGNGWGEV